MAEENDDPIVTRDVAEDLPMAEGAGEERPRGFGDEVMEAKYPDAVPITIQVDDVFDGKPISRERAHRILIERIGASGPRNMIAALNRMGNRVTGVNIHEFARKLATVLPEEMLNDAVLQQGDLRPILSQLMAAGEWGTDAEFGGVMFSAVERGVAGLVVTETTADLRKDIIDGLVAQIPFEEGSAEWLEAKEIAETTAANMVMEYRDGRVTELPQKPTGVGGYNPQTGEITTTGTTESEDEFSKMINNVLGGTSDEVRTAHRFLSEDEIRDMVVVGDMDFETARQLSAEGGQQQNDDGSITELTADAGVVYSDQTRPGPRSTQVPAGYAWSEEAQREADIHGERSTKDWYSLNDIKRKPLEMTRDELMVIHERMKKAGIFDMVGGEPSVPGDPTDPKFKAAWQQLAAMSLESGNSMTSILKERENAMEEALAAAFSTRLTDPARLRLNGDAYARDQIGRKLNDEEHAALTQFIHDLERRNAMIDAGLEERASGIDIEGVEGLDEGIVADIDARMSEWIATNNPGEEGARDIAEQYSTFTSLLRGPGRGI